MADSGIKLWLIDFEEKLSEEDDEFWDKFDSEGD